MTERTPDAARARYDGLESIPVRIVVRIGTTKATVARLSVLAQGDVVALDRMVGEPFDLMLSDRVVGRVEPVTGDAGLAVKLVSVSREESDEPL